MEEIKSKLSADLKDAMKSKDIVAVKTIRSLMSAIDNAGAVLVESPKVMSMSGGIAGATSGLGSTEVMRKELSGNDIKKIIQGEINEIHKAIELINDSSRPKVAQLEGQIILLNKYL